MRVGGTSRRNFDMFQKLCGQDAMKNVVIATNMWELVNDSNVAEARHQELITQDIFFKPAIEAGANILQHHNTKQSGEAIIRALLSCQPVPLQIQREIVDERRDITETAAGAALLRELTEMAERHKYEIDQIQVEMREALRNKDQETRMELDRARNELLEKQRRAEEERRLLVSNFTDEREALEREMGIIRRMLEEEAEARRLQERMVTQSHRSQQQRTNLMQQTNQRLHQQLAELQRRHNGGNLAGFSIMNLILPAMTALVAIMV